MKTVTDIDKWFRENAMHITDLINQRKISYVDYTYRMRTLIRKWDEHYQKLTKE